MDNQVGAAVHITEDENPVKEEYDHLNSTVFHAKTFAVGETARVLQLQE